MFGFSKQPHPSSAPYVVYPTRLAYLHQGHALWYPEPLANTGEPQIGDVGYMSEGAFIRLFSLNPSLEPEQQVTYWSKPFKPTALLDPAVFKELDQREALRPGHYTSQGVYRLKLGGSLNATAGPYASAGMSVEHTCTESQGAVLIIKSPAIRESIFNQEPLQKYMLAHYREWYAYAKTTLGHVNVDREEISLVTGWTKTSADWKAVAFTRTSASSQEASLKAHAVGVVSAKLHGERTRETEPPEIHREGALYALTDTDSSTTDKMESSSKRRKPKPSSKRRQPADSSSPGARTRSSQPGDTTNASGPLDSTIAGSGEVKKDQCLFVRRCMVKGRLLLKKIIAGAGPHRLPRQEDGRSGYAGEGLMVELEGEEDSEYDSLDYASEGLITDPLGTLLEYIFEVSGADTAIASDDDVENIVCGEHVVDFATYLRRVQPLVEVDGMVGSISIPDMISRDRRRAFARRAIAPTDIYKWPGLRFDNSCSLQTGKVSVGSTDANVRGMQWFYLVFADSGGYYRFCECFAISSDGTLLAASFSTDAVLVWRLSDGLLVQRLQYHQARKNRIQSVAFSPNARHLVSGSDDKTAIVRDIKNSRVLLRLEGHQDTVQAAAYSPDGSLIATGSRDRSVKIWDALRGQCLHSLDLGEAVCRIAFSPDGTLLTVQLVSMGVICDVLAGTVVATLQHEGDKEIRLSLSHQGGRIISGTKDGKTKIWNAVTGAELLGLGRLSERRGAAKINCMAFSPDGAEVAIALDDHTVVTCDSWTGQRLRVHRLSAHAQSVAYSPKGDYLAMGDSDGRLRMCDARSGAFVAEFEGHNEAVHELQFLPDGYNVLSHSKNATTVRLWNIRDAIRLR